jgi:hypothetical protein
MVKGVPYDGSPETEFRFFKVKYNATPENIAVHREFQEYCVRETDSGYLMGIKRLLDIAKSDWKYESLYSEIITLKQLVAELESKLEAPAAKRIEVKTFGVNRDG